MSKNVPTDVYIIYNSTVPKSKEYFETAKWSAIEHDFNVIPIDWPTELDECWKKVEDLDIYQHGTFLWNKRLYPTGKPEVDPDHIRGACSVTLAHMYIWNLIRKSDRAACIIEHDFIFKNSITMRIPSNFFVGLGYKLRSPDCYKIDSTNLDDAPKEVVFQNKILGAHGYAINGKTAKKLCDELKVKGVQGWIDCIYFQGNDMDLTDVQTSMMSPPPGIVWLRDSTIWNFNAIMNYTFIDSFSKRFVESNKPSQANMLSRHQHATIKSRNV